MMKCRSNYKDLNFKCNGEIFDIFKNRGFLMLVQ